MIQILQFTLVNNVLVIVPPEQTRARTLKYVKTTGFYFEVLHPVARILSRLLELSFATIRDKLSTAYYQ
jgi:hypothetical protein